MNRVAFVFAVVAGMMIAENRLSRRNEGTLRARGAVVPPGDPYVALSVLYVGSFIAMAFEGAWHAMHGAAPGTGAPAWALSGALLFAASKALKYWAIAALGDRWSFRVIVEPGRPLVDSGPYRYIAHPNYVAVIGELVGAAMMIGAPYLGVLGTLAFGAALAARVRFESRVLAPMRPARK